MTDDARFFSLKAQGIALTLDLSLGVIRHLAVERDGRRIEPLHAAPWLDEADIQADESLDPHLRGLAGDYLCAPFALNDIEPAPFHGWPANSAWSLIDRQALATGGATARFVLDRPVFGARLEKTLTLHDGHPFIYQSHIFTGGSGGITAAHHAMTRMPEGGRLSFSPKTYAASPPVPHESDPARGRSALLYPARTEDLTAFPLPAGGTVDLTHYPPADRAEDFLMLVEAAGATLGWAAALRAGSRDLVLSLKDPAVLPLTLLWFSNGGRDYYPWNGRHTGVLGMEEARCYPFAGHSASLAENRLRQSGIPTSFELGAPIEIRVVLGGIPVPASWQEVTRVAPDGDHLQIADRSGDSVRIPYDAAFLRGAAGADRVE